jgi:hypothetical protein
MHLDITAAVRIAGNGRASVIFHSKPEDPREPKLTLHANPYGFAQWFLSMTPPDLAFGHFFERRSLDYARARARQRMLEEKAETVPVPDQMPAFQKSMAVIALQLIKRWRNLAYGRRHAGRRCPPSVLLSYYVARHANQTRSLADELIHQVTAMVIMLETADREGRLIQEFNPACHYRRDELTDRWPGTPADQRIFLDELVGLGTNLHRLRTAPLNVMEVILADLFGEKPTGAAIAEQVKQRMADRKAGTSLYIPHAATIPPLGTVAAPAIARVAPGNTHFGD